MHREWDEPVVERWREIACDFCGVAIRGPTSDPLPRFIGRCEFCEKHVCQNCAWCHQENYYARCPAAHEYTRSCHDCKPIADAVVDDVRRSLKRYELFDAAMKRAVAAARTKPRRPPCPDPEQDPEGYDDWVATHPCEDCEGEGEGHDESTGEDWTCRTCKGTGIEPEEDAGMGTAMSEGERP